MPTIEQVCLKIISIGN